RANLHRQANVRQVDRVNAALQRHVVREDRSETTRLQFAADDECRQHGDTKAAQDRLGQGVVVVDAQGALDRNDDLVAGALETPLSLCAEVCGVQAVVLGQVVRYRGDAAPLEV